MNVGRHSLRLAVSFVVYPTLPDRKWNWISFEELAEHIFKPTVPVLAPKSAEEAILHTNEISYFCRTLRSPPTGPS